MGLLFHCSINKNDLLKRDQMNEKEKEKKIKDRKKGAL